MAAFRRSHSSEGLGPPSVILFVVLSSSIEGAAITAVKIEGVEHEFSSIKGVVEDATDVILNLKQVPLSCTAASPRRCESTRKRPAKLRRRISRLMPTSRFSIRAYIATVSEVDRCELRCA